MVDIGSGGSGPVGGGPDSSYESKALDVMNDEGTDETESPEPEPSEEPSEEPASEETDEADIPEEPEDVPEEESEDDVEEPEEKPEPVDDSKLTLSGKEAYDKLKKEFPEALKNNPALRQVFFREKAFSDIYTSVDEAKQAAQDSEFLNGMSAALHDGNIKSVINSLSDKAKENLAENFITELRSSNEQLFVRATAPFIANILNDAHEFGQSHGDKNLMASVLHLSRFLTGKLELPKRFVEKKPDPKLLEERQQFENEKRQFFTNQQQTFLSSADNAVQNGLTKLLATGLDPEGNMSQFMRNAIIADTIKEIKDYVGKDQAFQATLGDMVKRASRAGFDGGSKSRLISAYLGRVKDIALKIRANKVAEAKRTPRNGSPERNKINQKTDTGKRIAQHTQGSVKKPMSELDFIRAR